MVFSAVEMETPWLIVLMSFSLNSLDMLSSRSTFQVVSRHQKAYLRQPATGEPLEGEGLAQRLHGCTRCLTSSH